MSLRDDDSMDDEAGSGILMLGGVTLIDVSVRGGNRPPADVNETADGISIRMEVPGVSVRNVQVLVRGARVEVSGEKRPDQAGCDASYLCMERRFGKFRREFEVNGAVNLAEMTASLEVSDPTATAAQLVSSSDRIGNKRKTKVVVNRYLFITISSSIQNTMLSHPSIRASRYSGCCVY